MKAIIYEEYGSPEVLRLEEIKKPAPKDGEVLVKVHAASVNSWDWDLVRGKPYLYRLIFGILKPKIRIIGADIAGKIEAVGQNVTQFKPGDHVFGDLSGGSWGGFAEYVCAREDELVLKPASMTFEQAAAMPQAGVLALTGLRDKKQIQPGHKVLINGAGGGVGTFAVQMAKSFGAEVTAIDKPEKLDMLRSLGADKVIDYTTEDFTKFGERYDLVLDVMAHRSMFAYNRVLSPTGVYVMIGGSVPRIFELLFVAPWISLTTRKRMGILVHKQNKDLADLVTLFEDGKVLPVIDRSYPISEVPEAIRYLGDGHTKGKLVITM
jgi:NADPH:quinone reductase-like Zn-dependent oxidoreductase